MLRESVQCNFQIEWSVLCQQGVLGSLHIQLVSPKGSFFSFILDYCSSFPCGYECISSVASNLWRGPQNQHKASALQVFLMFCSLILVCLVQQQMRVCCHFICGFHFPSLSHVQSVFIVLIWFSNVCMVLLFFFPNMGDGVFDAWWKGLVKTELGKGRRQPLGPYYYYYYFQLCVTKARSVLANGPKGKM